MDGETVAAKMTWAERFRYGWDAVMEIIGRVWKYILIGIALGALIHGFVPEALMARIMAMAAGGDIRPDNAPSPRYWKRTNRARPAKTTTTPATAAAVGQGAPRINTSPNMAKTTSLDWVASTAASSLARLARLRA